jgi:2-polyprenyl-6-methoxyphenol hydroxylase-like FAD-dependent oxidoreductase
MDAEVIVVGGGIAGCALATRLAEADVSVLVLEREHVYRDVVRGDALVPWGFQEAVQLGIAGEILETKGVSVMTRMVPYDETLTVGKAQCRSRDLANVVDGAPGVVGVGTPNCGKPWQLRLARPGPRSFGASGARSCTGATTHR